MMLRWQKRTWWTTCFLATVCAGICNAQPTQGLSDVPTFGQATAVPTPSTAPLSGVSLSATQEPRVHVNALSAAPSVSVRYCIERPVTEQVSQGGKVVQVTRYVREARTAQVPVDANLDELDLPPDGKRAAVLAITAARHENLLEKLKGAEGDEEKKAAADALKENYTEHYAIETWWREQRLAELEERLKEMRDQVAQRQDAQEKYIDAAMTIAELWAEGIAIAPPKPGSATEHGTTAIPGPTIVPTAYDTVPMLPASRAPATYFESPPALPAPDSSDNPKGDRVLQPRNRS